jgi:DNA repair protein RadC
MQITYTGLRLVKEKEMVYRCDKSTITPKVIDELFDLSNRSAEVFGILCLNAQNMVTGASLVGMGGISSCEVNIKEIVKTAIVHNSTSVILFHNHPGGHPEPSPADVDVTTLVVGALSLADIRVTDHVIIASTEKYYSFAERHWLPDRFSYTELIRRLTN